MLVLTLFSGIATTLLLRPPPFWTAEAFLAQSLLDNRGIQKTVYAEVTARQHL
jgi:hypothetical protein